MTFSPCHPDPVVDPRAEAMLPAVGGFPVSDRPIFLAGYAELCRVDLSGKRVLEICGGHGRLAALLARTFPTATVIGLDIYKVAGPEVDQWLDDSPGLSYVVGDAMDLSAYEDESFDLVWGQAALHHLTHDPEKLSQGVFRVLKPGGRFVFVFEPLGHNVLVAAIRAARMARAELVDESNLYFSLLERMCKAGFSNCDVQVFNIFGYLMKGMSDRFAVVSNMAHRIDTWLFRRFPRLLRYGANCNVIFTK